MYGFVSLLVCNKPVNVVFLDPFVDGSNAISLQDAAERHGVLLELESDLHFESASDTAAYRIRPLNHDFNPIENVQA